MRGPFFPKPHQHLVSVILILATSEGLQSLHCGYICLFLMTNDIEHFLMVLLVIHVSFFVKCLFKSFTNFGEGVYLFLIGLQELFMEPRYQFLPDRHYLSIFLQFVACLFIFLMLSFHRHKF